MSRKEVQWKMGGIEKFQATEEQEREKEVSIQNIKESGRGRGRGRGEEAGSLPSRTQNFLSLDRNFYENEFVLETFPFEYHITYNLLRMDTFIAMMSE